MTVPLSNLTDTWNASGTTWKGIQLNVTDTGHAAASMLLDLQVGGTSVFNVDPSGVVDAGTTEAVFMQSGDTFGTSRLRMRNRSNQNGAVIENAGLDLSDLVLLTSTAAQGVLRFEHRSANLLNSSNSGGELQFLITLGFASAFAIGPASIDINGASGVAFRVYNSSGADLGDILLGGIAPGTNWGNVRYEHRSGQFMDSANTAGEMQFLVGGNQIVGHGPSVHSLRNGTTAQTLRVYNTFTDASNYERGAFDWASNVLTIGAQAAGTGTLRSVKLVGSDITIKGDTATPAGGSTAARLLFGTTSGFGIYYGSGAPTVSAAAGSIYIRTDNAGANLRLYSNTTGSTTWAAITSA